MIFVNGRTTDEIFLFNNQALRSLEKMISLLMHAKII